ncbi:MAG: hypothetical protein WB988_02235 [Candidatus Nitrosopolaris sp.]|jgi:hypothetical protein
MATTTAGEQSVLAVCLFIKQWYCIQQANEQKYRRNRQSVVQALVPAMFQLFQLSTYLSKSISDTFAAEAEWIIHEENVVKRLQRHLNPYQ